MNTLDVMCMEFTRQSPSRTPLSRTAASTSRVMFTKSMRRGTWSASTLRKLFTVPSARASRASFPVGEQTPERVAHAVLEHDEAAPQVEDHLDAGRVHAEVAHERRRHAQVVRLLGRDLVVEEEPLAAEIAQQLGVVDAEV